jgi:hypothetical protein
MRSLREAQRAPLEDDFVGSAFVKEHFGMLTPPPLTSSAVLSDKDAKTHTGALVFLFAGLTKLQHPFAELITSRGRHDYGRTPVGSAWWPHFNAVGSKTNTLRVRRGG